MTVSSLWIWIFRVTSVLVAVVSLRALIAPVSVVMPNMAHYLPDLQLAVLAHVVFGPLALALAPFQLSRGLRGNRPGLHRAMGYVYVLSIAISAAGTLAFLPSFAGSTWAATGFAMLALLWFATTAIGVHHARQRNFAAHRVWILRSVALTFAAVTLRIYMPVLIAFGMPLLATYDITGWLCWVPNLLVVEWWLRRRRTVQAA